MPILGFNIGKDTSLDLVHPTQGIISFGLVTSFDAKPIKTRLDSRPITNGGRAVYRIVYHGWEGTFELDRNDGTLDLLMALLESSFYSGLPETYFLLSQEIHNPDGSIDRFRYTNVVFEPEGAGVYRGEEKVSQRFAFVASQRIKA